MRIGRDKLMHAGVCFAAAIALAATGIWTPTRRFLFVTVGLGVTKELYDYAHRDKHDAELSDIAADAAGALVGELVAWLVLR